MPGVAHICGNLMNILVLGLGNILLQDEELGVRVLERLEREAIPTALALKLSVHQVDCRNCLR
jgi:Ni,Fe-hydrogenase maturation factor